MIHRLLCTLALVLWAVALVSCATVPPQDPAMPAPPGELLIKAPPALARLDISKPMPQQQFLGQSAFDAGQYRNVVDQLSKLQDFVIAHCKCITAPPAAHMTTRATLPPVPLVAAAELPPRDGDPADDRSGILLLSLPASAPLPSGEL